MVHKMHFELLTLIRSATLSSLSTRREGEEGELKFIFIFVVLKRISIKINLLIRYCTSNFQRQQL